eukprot:CAMPEP_0202476044 /NCGR_PEP_ID=MMETSP1360-20130828/93212_1 /ASSEMBLY_ACC=CAM_ASM_000848 /TAXON_ID=515479 /ORGANISM="Licmophora paradoxa, Strain CCMP2313" /LENGTH=292 /DNA_ID=CAMNT_0049103229 /DNA_START=339 /DNA_END=1217 /DNA_ORIENTATION=-
MMMISPGGDNSDDTTAAAAADTDTLDDEEQAKPVTGTGTGTGTTLPSPPPLEQQQQQQQQQHYQQHMGPKAKSPPGLLRSLFPTLPWHRLPNLLTYLRCLSIPLFIATFYQDRPVTSSVIFALSSITDWLDGYLARRWDIASDFGAFLDPVADKLMVSTALILLTGKQLVLQFAAAATAETATTALKITNHHNILIAIPTSIILAREIAVSALREWMAQRNQRNAVKVGWQGKLKTATTMVAITILLLSTSTEPTTSPLFLSGMALLYVSMILTVTSGSVYFRAAAPVLLGK